MVDDTATIMRFFVLHKSEMINICVDVSYTHGENENNKGENSLREFSAKKDSENLFDSQLFCSVFLLV